jgi:quercetin dioxygenase-like cupin family protein
MKAKDIRDLVHFSEDGPRRATLWETERLWSEVICLERNQRVGPIGDPVSDAICTVLAGEVATQVGRGRARITQWESVQVPAGQTLTLANASDEPSVVLLVVAPPPGGEVVSDPPSA